jgi:bla regulator protein BlaR1
MTIPGFFTPASCPPWAVAVINHLVQSTAVVVIACLLTLLLRSKAARVRYAIWMVASIKFLVPFALLGSIGAHWAAANPSSPARASFFVFVEEISQPVRAAQPIAALPSRVAGATAPSSHSVPLVPIIAALWLAGFLAMLVIWIARWRRAALIAASSQPVTSGREFDALRRIEKSAGITSPIRLAFSPGETEPGVFGIFRPILLWPRGLSERLSDAQIQAIVSHEVEHVCRRDNVSASLHALTHSIFWFHPLLRWMSAKLNEERERACDESVLERDARPETYAESILKVCEFCLEPPNPCIAGVSGADLKERILHIMTRQPGIALNLWQKTALAATVALMLAAPIGIGVVHGQAAAPPTSAPSSKAVDLPKYEVASIKPYKADDFRVRIMLTPDGISFHGVPARMMLQQAFGVEDDRILGEPAWIKSNRYDVEAKVAPEDAPRLKDLKVEQRNAMMLQLLVDRFNLKYHHEQRELPMYAMVVAKGGLKMKPTQADPPGTTAPDNDGPPPSAGSRPPMGKHMLMMNPGHLESTGASTDMLSHIFSRQLQRTVVDKTGLSGEYDFTLDYTPDNMPMPPHGGPDGGPKPEGPADQGGPSLFTAVEEQLGLKLEATKGIVDVIVIDHIDPPTEN